MSTAVNSEDFSVSRWQANATAQIVSASISFLASLIIVASTSKIFFSLQRNSKHDEANEVVNNKKTSPYRRIIFLISASDILYSLAFITGPFMAKKTNPQALWAVSDSNIACAVNGFFFTVGATASLLYYASLCYFYYCKISKQMNDEEFKRRYEKKIHIMIGVICIASSCVSFALNTLHTYPTGTFCSNTTTPAGCNQQPEIYGECDLKIKVYVSYFTYFNLLVISTYSIVVMIYSMIRLVYSVSNKDRIYGDLPANPTDEQLHIYTLRKQLLRETMSQAIMYTGSWFICQSALIAVAFYFFRGGPLEKFPPVVCFALVPLNGAFNVFIYTRPAVRHVRRVDPSISRLRALYMVLKAGGEAPKMDQSSTSTNHQLQQQQPLPEKSSREPFQCYYYDGNDLCLSLDSLNYVSSVDLRVMIGQDSMERVAVTTWSGQNLSNTTITSNCKIRGLEGVSFGEDVKDCSHYYDPRSNFGGKDGIDTSNTNMNVATNSNIDCFEDSPFAEDGNEYNHYDVNTLER
ncbi:hypothetical protein CTEN210_18076 [Chaetoceros tenuissimus]|uniref:G-protein coupled receptors family 1 profile domain-containing protein n=1 Tax=Chaetoceros tenuissimus TaxID=426638 RepID=A0AAD3DEN2_9STRA|nr:hypothetical protein CTEN210_18076 [Chaetoceros tenuissimus]